MDAIPSFFWENFALPIITALIATIVTYIVVVLRDRLLKTIKLEVNLVDRFDDGINKGYLYHCVLYPRVRIQDPIEIELFFSGNIKHWVNSNWIFVDDLFRERIKFRLGRDNSIRILFGPTLANRSTEFQFIMPYLQAPKADTISENKIDLSYKIGEMVKSDWFRPIPESRQRLVSFILFFMFLTFVILIRLIGIALE